jgi:predicted metal-dependent phosphoesterase TrpH
LEVCRVNIDLHIHTTASDGSLTPAQVVREAIQAGLSVISIADHDTTSGVAAALEEKDAHDIVVVPGVEISASHPSGEVHILGYWMDYENPDFQAFLERPRSTRVPRIIEMCGRLRGIGLEVRPEEVFEEAGGTEAVGRPHLARVLLAKGYVKDMEEAFRNYLTKGTPGYVKRVKNRTAETIAMIHRCGGISVIAHPGLLEDPGLVDHLIREGVMGIEVLCHEHDREAVEKFSAIAERNGLLKTGGSDYHGDMLEKSFRLGDLKVPYEYYLALKEAKGKKTGAGDQGSGKR